MQQNAEIGIRVDSVAADERGCAGKYRLIGGIAADGSERRQLLQCLGQ